MNGSVCEMFLYSCACIEHFFGLKENCMVYVFVQAFLEMNTEEAAQTMVTYYSSVTPVIRNHPIFMQYSNHKELKTDNSPNQVVCASNSFSVHPMPAHVSRTWTLWSFIPLFYMVYHLKIFPRKCRGQKWFAAAVHMMIWYEQKARFAVSYASCFFGATFSTLPLSLF